MTGNMKIEGEKEVQAVFTRTIKYYPTRVVAAGIRKAMAPFTNRAKALNPRFGHLYKAKVMVKKDVMGRVKKGQTRRTPIRRKGDDYISEWQRNVWIEYGTLANRSKSHSFKSPRRRKSARWRGGIKAIMATERAWNTTGSMVISRIPAEVKASADKFDKRNKV